MDGGRSYAFKITYLARLARIRFDRRARDLGLTRAQWQTIAAISLNQGTTQSEIAVALEVSTVTIGRLVEKLEQDQWIERRPDPSDRRAYRLHLRPEVVPTLERLGEIAKQEERQMLCGLDADDRAMLDTLLDRLVVNLESRDVGDATSEAGDSDDIGVARMPTRLTA